jgi:hypothetical protein
VEKLSRAAGVRSYFGCEEEDAMRAREYCRHFRDNETKFERRFILGLHAVKKDGAWFEDLIEITSSSLECNSSNGKESRAYELSTQRIK